MRKESIEEARGYFTSTVALVTSKNGQDTNIMSAEWSLRVSLDPFLMAVFVGYERATYDLIKESGQFGLNYCSDRQAHLSSVAGNYSMREKNKFQLADFNTFQAQHIAAPLIGGAISNFECEVVNEYQVGDHAAFVGKVLTAYYDDEQKPMVYHNGKYWKVGERIPKEIL